ncbi:unnamed protein product [Alopecurus aequalis]
MKVSQDAIDVYDKFVNHRKNLKTDRQKKKKAIMSHFIRISRFHCEYKPFFQSLEQRHFLDSQVMALWTENVNKKTKAAYERSKNVLKKYVFSPYFTMRIIVDPEEFDPSEVLKELKSQNLEYKIFKNDLLHFPVVKKSHWILCTVNLLHNQNQIFDSMKDSKNQSILDEAANNLFRNFRTLSAASELCIKDLSTFPLVTTDHPQQKTIFDCGFFTMLFIQHFNAKVMLPFAKDDIPNFRMCVAGELIKNRDNTEDDLEAIMKEELED